MRWKWRLTGRSPWRRWRYEFNFSAKETEEEEEFDDDDDDDDDDDNTVYHLGVQLKLLFNDAFYKGPSQLSQLTLQYIVQFQSSQSRLFLKMPSHRR